MSALTPRQLRGLLGLIGFTPLIAFAQVTETPLTVAPGHVLIRADGLKLSLDRADAAGNTYSAVAVAGTTVRAGLTQNVDLQVGFDLFLKETLKFRGRSDSHSGLGDVSLRTKWVFWRNDQYGAAAAFLPYVKIPSGTGGVGSDAVEGGFIVPWAMNNGAGITSGAMFEWDVVRNDAHNGYDSRWYISGFAQRDLTKFLSVYTEATLETFSSGASGRGTFGVGALWHLSKTWQFDYELQHGLTHAAAEWIHIWRVNWLW
jgi:hypothetical protein